MRSQVHLLLSLVLGLEFLVAPLPICEISSLDSHDASLEACHLTDPSLALKTHHYGNLYRRVARFPGISSPTTSTPSSPQLTAPQSNRPDYDSDSESEYATGSPTSEQLRQEELDEEVRYREAEENGELESSGEENLSDASAAGFQQQQSLAYREMSDVEVRGQTEDGRMRREAWEKERDEWQGKTPKPADRGFNGDITTKKYVHWNDPSPVDPNRMNYQVANDKGYQILEVDVIASERRIKVINSAGKDEGEDDKDPSERLWWSDLVMSGWRENTTPEQRTQLSGLMRYNIAPQTIKTQDSKGNEVDLVTAAAMNHLFEKKGKVYLVHDEGHKYFNDLDLVKPGSSNSNAETDEMWDLMTRQVHVDRVYKMLRDYRGELGDKEITQMRLQHERGKARNFNIIMDLE